MLDGDFPGALIDFDDFTFDHGQLFRVFSDGGPPL